LPPDLWRRAGFGLYIHWPYCQAKCPYCDFNSHVAAVIDQDRWADAYLREIARVRQQTQGRVLSTVYFGGGTPSLMRPDTVARILEAVRASWPMANDPEITLEANPTSVESSRFQGFRDAGVTRVSLGVQALNDADLRRLGRLHTVSDAIAAFDLSRRIFDRVSFDLIYARQDQTLADWRAELTRALAMTQDHLSLYQLTIEPGTAFWDRHTRGGLTGLPDEDLSADMFLETQELCDRAGLAAYEISNHAAPGAQSRHNLIYWRSGDYAGIGPGAHGRLTHGGQRMATETWLEPQKWLEAVEMKGSGESERMALSDDEHAQEYLMMGLRLAEGIPVAGVQLIDNIREKLQAVMDDGLLALDGDRLSLTECGRPLLNAVLRALLA